MSAEGREPYGLDHVGPRWTPPKLANWRRASPLFAEVGLRAAAWSDFPYDLHNALRPLRDLEPPLGMVL